MPADSNNSQNNSNAQNPGQQPSFSMGQQPLSQISSSDAPPLPPGVNPVSDVSSPQPSRDFDPNTYSAPNVINSAPAPTPIADNPTTLNIENPDTNNAPPPPTSAPVASSTVSSGSGSSFPIKKLAIILGSLLLVGLIIFLFVRFVLPMLSGDSNQPAIKQTEIVWWGLWEDQTIVAPLINEYQENNPGIKITYVPQSKENYRERLTSAFARGEGPDVFRYHNSWVSMFSQELATLPDSVMSRQVFSQTYYPVMTRDLSISKGIVGIPLMYDGLAMFVNDEIFTTFGVTPPVTWNEFEELALDLTVRDANGVIQQSGASLGLTENVDHWQEILALIMLQNGVNLNNPADVTSDRAAEALQFYTDFASTNGTWDETLPNSTIAFAAGNVGMYLAPSWRVFEIQQQNPDLQFRVLPVPQIPGDDETSPKITYASYWVEGVSEDSDKKDEAWKFLRYLSEAETLQSFYQSASQIRLFGEPYPRQDMRSLLLNAPKVGGFLELAPQAQSWYLASRTWDGNTGINTRISQYFEDAVNGMTGRSGGNAASLLQAVAAGVQEVLVQYGLATPAPVSSD